MQPHPAPTMTHGYVRGARSNEDSQCIPNAVGPRLAQFVGAGADDGPGDPHGVKGIGLALAPPVAHRLGAALDDAVARCQERPGHPGAVRADALHDDQGHVG